MHNSKIIAAKEFRTAYKDKVFIMIVLLFLLMSIASVYIGSTTKNAELKAYQDIVSVIQSEGGALPAAPEIFPLAILKNIITYITMIGAVLAIFLGFDSFSSERENGTLKLLLSKPVYRDQLITGKLLGAGVIIGGILIVTLLFNLTLFIVTTGLLPGVNEILRLVIFFFLAFVYMMSFYIVTLYVSIRTQDRTSGFLIMMVLWVFISFVIPQLADTQKNFAYALNSIASTVTQIPSDTALSKTIEYFSPAVQFSNVSGDLLQTVSATATTSVASVLGKNLPALLDLFFPGILFLILSYTRVQREDAI